MSEGMREDPMSPSGFRRDICVACGRDILYGESARMLSSGKLMHEKCAQEMRDQSEFGKEYSPFKKHTGSVSNRLHYALHDLKQAREHLVREPDKAGICIDSARDILQRLARELGPVEGDDKLDKLVTPSGAVQQYGWICPKCGRGNAPGTGSCPCVPYDLVAQPFHRVGTAKDQIPPYMVITAPENPPIVSIDAETSTVKEV